jgi:hypothetical protein
MRKKVNTETPKETSPKKREEVKNPSNIIRNSSNDTKVKWDKVKGINGKIVRYKMDDPERKEYLSKKNYRQLCVAIDGNDLYFYYEILN